jgi:hypothetical protein
MGINSQEEREAYVRLCAVVRERGGSVKLKRESGGGWGLLATLPLDDGNSVVAAGFIVRELSELDLVAYCLLDWLDCVYEQPSDDAGPCQSAP